MAGARFQAARDPVGDDVAAAGPQARLSDPGGIDRSVAGLRFHTHRCGQVDLEARLGRFYLVELRLRPGGLDDPAAILSPRLNPHQLQKRLRDAAVPGSHLPDGTDIELIGLPADDPDRTARRPHLQHTSAFTRKCPLVFGSGFERFHVLRFPSIKPATPSPLVLSSHRRSMSVHPADCAAHYISSTRACGADGGVAGSGGVGGCGAMEGCAGVTDAGSSTGSSSSSSSEKWESSSSTPRWMRPGQDSAREVGFREVRAGQDRAGEVRAGKAGLGQVGAGEISAGQVRVGEVRFRHVGVRKIGAREV